MGHQMCESHQANKIHIQNIAETLTGWHGYFKIKPYAITRLTTDFMCGLMSDLVICMLRKSIIIHDTECPY